MASKLRPTDLRLYCCLFLTVPGLSSQQVIGTCSGPREVKGRTERRRSIVNVHSFLHTVTRTTKYDEVLGHAILRHSEQLNLKLL